MSDPQASSLQAQEPQPANPSAGVDKQTRTRVVAASFIGNFVEWFDYAVYGYLAVTITAVFFPESDPKTGLMLHVRPVCDLVPRAPPGRVRLGPPRGPDRAAHGLVAGRSCIMSMATFCIALIPGYATIGFWAPVLLLVVRVVQGFSASGEYAGASAFLVEYAPANKRGLYAAVVPASTATGPAARLADRGPADRTARPAQMHELGLAAAVPARRAHGPDRPLHPDQARGHAGLPRAGRRGRGGQGPGRRPVPHLLAAAAPGRRRGPAQRRRLLRHPQLHADVPVRGTRARRRPSPTSPRPSRWSPTSASSSSPACCPTATAARRS